MLQHRDDQSHLWIARQYQEMFSKLRSTTSRATARATAKATAKANPAAAAPPILTDGEVRELVARDVGLDALPLTHVAITTDGTVSSRSVWARIGAAIAKFGTTAPTTR